MADPAERLIIITNSDIRIFKIDIFLFSFYIGLVVKLQHADED
jgi:hypothetical protein